MIYLYVVLLLLYLCDDYYDDLYDDYYDAYYYCYYYCTCNWKNGKSLQADSCWFMRSTFSSTFSFLKTSLDEEIHMPREVFN